MGTPGRAPPDRHPSPDPTSERMLNELKTFLTSFCAPIRRQPGTTPVRFGHITTPPYRLRHPSLMELIATALPSTGDKNDLRRFFVMTDYECQMITEEITAELCKGTFPAVIATFADILQALRGIRRCPGSSRLAWQTTTDPLGWEKNGGIPRRAIIVIQLDPQVSADSALALIALVQWVFDICADTRASLHVLTMSTDPGYNIVPAIAELRCPGIVVAELNLAALAEHDPVANAQVIEEQGITSKIDEAIDRIGQRSLAVILIGDATVAGNESKPGLDRTELQHARRMAQFNCSRRWVKGLPNIWILEIKGNCPLLPTALEGYEEVHVVLGPSYRDVAWHNDAGQLAVFNRITARDERRDQLWWARQPNTKATYVYTGGSSIEAFLEAGHHRHRLIEDAHLGGFIASVFDMQSWGIDAKRVIRRCMQAPALNMAMEMLDRLHVQRVISRDGLILPELDAKAFRSILPLVDYDHRLALFVALDSGDSDDIVRMVKVQLAAVAGFGLERVFSFKSLDQDLFEVLEKNPQLPSMIYDACAGYGRGLAPMGTMWLSLGLWKHFLKTEYASFNAKYKALHDLIAIDRALSQLAETRANEMYHALQGHGILVPPAMQVVKEANDINEAQKLQLQAHLLRSFLHQLVAVYIPDGSSSLAYDLIATDTTVSEISHSDSIAGILPIDQIHEMDAANCSFGVCHLLHKFPGKSAFLAYDWTHIPVSVVAQWKDENAQDMDLCDALTSGIPPLSGNCDEWHPIEDS